MRCQRGETGGRPGSQCTTIHGSNETEEDTDWRTEQERQLKKTITITGVNGRRYTPEVKEQTM